MAKKQKRKKSNKRNPKDRSQPQGRGSNEAKTAGSENPMDHRCGAYLQRTDPPRYCKRYPLKGRTRCKIHGGATPRGPDSPHWKHGKRSLLYEELLSGSLLKGYLDIKSDEELVTTEEQIRLWSARERQLVEQLLDHAERQGQSWRAARMAAAEVEAAKEPAELARALNKLKGVILDGSAQEELWDKLATCHEMQRKLKEAEQKKRRAEHAMITEDQMRQLASIFTMHALRYISDEQARLKFAEDVNRLMQGEPIDLEDPLVQLELKH